jgi:hypothetical protein
VINGKPFKKAILRDWRIINMSFCNIEKAQIIMKEVNKLDLDLTEEEVFKLKIAINDGFDQVDKKQREYDRMWNEE